MADEKSLFDGSTPIETALAQLRLRLLDLTARNRLAPLPALARGELDLVVTSDPQEIPGINYVPLFAYEAMLAISNQHPLINRNHVEPADLCDETLICYPVDRDRLDIFTQFLDPAGIQPVAIRNAELTVMMMQLVASGRGVCCLPNWAMAEYLQRGYVSAKPLGTEGLFGTLYAAVREDMLEMSYLQDFLFTAKDISFATLEGVGVTSVVI